jgi:hypothetical protein
VSERGLDGGDDELAWLLALERGEVAAPPSEQLAARHQRLAGLIGELPEVPPGVTPRAGWEQRVFAALDAVDAELSGAAEPSRAAKPPGAVEPRRGADPADEPSGAADPPAAPPSPEAAGTASEVQIVEAVTEAGPFLEELASSPRRAKAAPATWWRIRGWRSAGVLAAAAVAVLIVVLRPGTTGQDEPKPVLAFELELELVKSSEPRRGDEPSVGDTLRFSGGVDGPGELRVYDDAGVEQARCAVPAANCVITRDRGRTRLQLSVPLRVPGALRAVLFKAPLSGPSGGLDADVAAAGRVGIAVLARDPVRVH